MTLNNADPTKTTADPTATTENKTTESQGTTTQQNAGSGSGAGKNTEVDLDNPEWLDEVQGLDAGQKKWLKKTITQNRERKEKLDEAKQKLSEKESAEREAQRQRDIEQGNYKKVAEDSEKTVASMKERLMRAEVRAYAIKEGIVDPTIVDLLPLEGVSINDSLEVVGAEKAIGKYKREKPYLFGGKQDQGTQTTTQTDPQGTTSTRTTPAQSGKPAPKDALKMTDEEFQRSMNELLANERKSISI